jgi:hypothetical protein
MAQKLLAALSFDVIFRQTERQPDCAWLINNVLSRRPRISSGIGMAWSCWRRVLKFTLADLDVVCRWTT